MAPFGVVSFVLEDFFGLRGLDHRVFARGAQVIWNVSIKGLQARCVFDRVPRLPGASGRLDERWRSALLRAPERLAWMQTPRRDPAGGRVPNQRSRAPEPQTRALPPLNRSWAQGLRPRKTRPGRSFDRHGWGADYLGYTGAVPASNKVSNAVLLSRRWQISRCCTRARSDKTAHHRYATNGDPAEGCGRCSCQRESRAPGNGLKQKKGGCRNGIRPMHHRPGGGR